MDAKDQELYFEEQRNLLIGLGKSVDKLIDVFAGKVSIEYKQAESQKVTGKVEVENPVTEMKVTNNAEITEALKGFAETVAAAIRESKTDPVTEVSVKNVKDAAVDEVTVKNIKDLTEYFDKVADAIVKGRPVVKIEKQEISWPTDPRNPIAVRLSDGRSFYRAIATAMAGGVSTAGLATNAKLDEVIAAVGGSAKYHVKIDEASSTVTYVGKAELTGLAISLAAAVWQIQKIDESSGTDISFADGDELFDNVWNDRGSLTYA